MKKQKMNNHEEVHWRVLGQCVRERRKACGWSQQNLADETGLSRTEIQYIESGKRHAKSGTLERICKAFGIWQVELMLEVARVSLGEKAVAALTWPTLVTAR